MSISALSTATNANSSSGQTQRKVTLNQEDFLNLLITQLQNQDPTAPMDSTQMASQMAQFSTLNALNDISTSLQNLNASQATLTTLQASSLIGKTVNVNGNTLSVTGVTVENGTTYLNCGSEKISLSDITAISN